MNEIKGVKLTDDTLTNLHIMAPLLDQRNRELAFVYMFGLINGEGKSGENDAPRKDGTS